MKLIKKLLLIIFSAKIVKHFIIHFIKKVILRNDFINEIFSLMTNHELQVLIDKLLIDDRMQQDELYDDLINKIINKDSFITKLAENDKFIDQIILEDRFISKFANRNEYITLKPPSNQSHFITDKTIHKKPEIRNNARISILICTPNIQSDFAKRCINSVKKYTKDFTYELLFFENGKLHDFNHAREINRALSISLGDYLVTLDEDVEVTPNWLESLLKYAEPDVGVVGCMNLNSNPKYGNTIRYTGTWVDFDGNVHSYVEKISEPINSPFVCSACILINNKNLRFNEEYTKYYQEVDFCYQIWESDQRVVVAPHSIYHYVEGTLQTLGFDRSRIIDIGEKDKDLFKKIWIDTGRMHKLYTRIQPHVPFKIGECPKVT